MTDSRSAGAPARLDAHQDILKNLVAMGFSMPEARTYAALLQVQPATAYELAKISGLPRANSYSAVSSLVLKGAIQPISSQPVRYAVSSPRQYFLAMAEELTETSRAVIQQIAELTPAPMPDFVEVREGRRAVESHIRASIGAAERDLHVKTRDTLAAPFLDDLAAAAGRGVKVTIVASGEEWRDLAGTENVTIVPHEGTGSVPSDPHRVLLTLTADDAEAFVGALGDTPRGYSARNRTLVYVFRTMILHEIYLAEIVRAIGLERLAEAGVDFETLRGRFRPPSHGSRLAEDP